MVVFASTLRTAHRPHHPVGRTASSRVPTSIRPARGSMTHLRERRDQAAAGSS